MRLHLHKHGIASHHNMSGLEATASRVESWEEAAAIQLFYIVTGGGGNEAIGSRIEPNRITAACHQSLWEFTCLCR